MTRGAHRARGSGCLRRTLLSSKESSHRKEYWGLKIGTIEIGLGGNGRVTLLQVRYAGEVTG